MEILMHGACMSDLTIEMCCFLLGNSIQFLLKYKTLECGCLHCSYSSAFFCLFWVGFVCFLGFLLFKGRNELRLKVAFLGSARVAVLCEGGEEGKGTETVPLYGSNKQYLLLLANGSQKRTSHCHQLIWLKKMANLFLKYSIDTRDV